MRRQTFVLLFLLALLVAGAVATYALFVVGDGDSPDADAGSPGFAETRDALLAAPQQVDVLLTVDVWKTTDRAERVRKEITALGEVDFESGDAELVYDYQGTSNAAGLLGDPDTMQALYDDGTGYLELLTTSRPWVRIEPEDASNPHVARLREVMLTAPIMLPGLLEVAENSDPTAGPGAPSRVQVSALAGADDDIAAGIGSALEEIGADQVTIVVTGDERQPSEITVGFSYPGRQDETEVEVTYGLLPLDTEVSVEAPERGRVQSFSSLVGA